MDLFRSMTVFAEVARSGSMSAASRKLLITPAMVGQYIAALEERLGMRLLNRTTRKQKLTDFGLSYLEQCHDILERVAASETQGGGIAAILWWKTEANSPCIFWHRMPHTRIAELQENGTGCCNASQLSN
jgi:Transcriptional regulator